MCSTLFFAQKIIILPYFLLEISLGAAPVWWGDIAGGTGDRGWPAEHQLTGRGWATLH